MISTFKDFYKKISTNDIVKPTKNSRKHSQSLNRNTIDRKKGLNFVPDSDIVKRSHYIIKRFKLNKNLKYLPIPNEMIANKLANIFNLNISKESGDFKKSLKRTDLILMRTGTKYFIVRKK